MKQGKKKVLCVDDEPAVLEGLALQLRRDYEVATATSGELGLEMLRKEGHFVAVLSDMRMPGMNGAVFLAQVLRQAPDTVRLLLTGQADLQSAIDAVNEGQIFRFLTKPCLPDQLRGSIAAAVEQHRLLTAERVLLEQTLHGSIKTLTDILALTSPAAFGRATRIRKHAGELARELEMRDHWQVEVAAMLAPLGSICLPLETAEKYYFGRNLTSREAEMVGRIPEVTEDLLANIPRLEPVRDILATMNLDFAAQEDGMEIPLGARILRIAADLEDLESAGTARPSAFAAMRNRRANYDPDLLTVFEELKRTTPDAEDARKISLRELCVGMVFSEEVRTENGVLLVGRGYEVTRSLIERLRNIKTGTVAEPLLIHAFDDEEE